MIRSSRLMATMLAALFAAVLATPAYATYGTSTCDTHARTYGTGCKAEGTKFHDLNADGKRDAGEPGLAGWRIWADYDDDGVRDSGEPFDDTDASGRYTIEGIKPTATSMTRTYSTGRSTACASSAPAAAPAGGSAHTPTPRPPAASPTATAATSAVATARSTSASTPRSSTRTSATTRSPRSP